MRAACNLATLELEYQGRERFGYEVDWDATEYVVLGKEDLDADQADLPLRGRRRTGLAG